MESVTSHNVNDLPPAERQTLETIVGRHLQPDERVSIRVYGSKVEPDEALREAARENLERTFARIDEYGKEHGIIPEEADAAVEEAIEHIRPRNP